MQNGTIIARLTGTYEGESGIVSLVSVEREFEGYDAIEDMERAYVPENVIDVFGNEYLGAKALTEEDIEDTLFRIEIYDRSSRQWHSYQSLFYGRARLLELVGV